MNVNTLNSFFATVECEFSLPALPVIDDSLELFSFDLYEKFLNM